MFYNFRNYLILLLTTGFILSGCVIGSALGDVAVSAISSQCTFPTTIPTSLVNVSKVSNSTTTLVESGACVIDSSTGLVWQQNPSATKLFYYQASSTSLPQGLCGYIDWRLPTYTELSGLFNESGVTDVFTNIQTGATDYYWTQTFVTLGNDSYTAYVVVNVDESINYTPNNQIDKNYMFPVRGSYTTTTTNASCFTITNN